MSLPEPFTSGISSSSSLSASQSEVEYVVPRCTAAGFSADATPGISQIPASSAPTIAVATRNLTFAQSVMGGGYRRDLSGRGTPVRDAGVLGRGHEVHLDRQADLDGVGIDARHRAEDERPFVEL